LASFGLSGDAVFIGFDEREGATIEVAHLDALAADLGLDAEELRKEPLSFHNRFGTWHGPWPAALRVAKRVAETYPGRVLEKVAEEEGKLLGQSVTGSEHRFRDGSGWTVPSVAHPAPRPPHPEGGLPDSTISLSGMNG
jgi:hypothetical protein